MIEENSTNLKRFAVSNENIERNASENDEKEREMMSLEFIETRETR